MRTNVYKTVNLTNFRLLLGIHLLNGIGIKKLWKWQLFLQLNGQLNAASRRPGQPAGCVVLNLINERTVDLETTHSFYQDWEQVGVAQFHLLVAGLQFQVLLLSLKQQPTSRVALLKILVCKFKFAIHYPL